jgi:hypothetical protein
MWKVTNALGDVMGKVATLEAAMTIIRNDGASDQVLYTMDGFEPVRYAKMASEKIKQHKIWYSSAFGIGYAAQYTIKQVESTDDD